MAERRAQPEAGHREAGEDQGQAIQGRMELVQRPGKLHGEPRAGRPGEDTQVLPADFGVGEERRLADRRRPPAPARQPGG